MRTLSTRESTAGPGPAALRSFRSQDVVAGHSSDDGLVILGLVLLLAGRLVLLAVSGDSTYDDGCYCY